jgi:hypothetical protein
LPTIFTGGQVLPSAKCPTLIAWIWDKEPALKVLSDPKASQLPVVPRHEETWLQVPARAWDSQELFDKVALKPMPNAPDTTMLILNGPPVQPQGLLAFFDEVAAVTERAAGWQASVSEMQDWATKLADVELPLSPYARTLVRWIAAMDHIANV